MHVTLKDAKGGNIMKRDKTIIKQAGFSLVIVSLLLGSCNNRNKKSAKNPQPDTLSYASTKDILKDYHLIWEDKFEGDSLDRTKWNYRAEGNKRNYAKVDRKTIALDGEGHLIIQVIKDQDDDYLVGQTGTEDIFETQYGYFETRAKMNKEIGPHVAFWLQTPDIHKTNNAPAHNGAEVDIFEYHQKTPDLVHHNIHWNGYGEEHKIMGTKKSAHNIDKGFHTFGLLWTPDRYIFYYDGQKSWETSKAVSHRKEYIILSTELTGFGGDPEKGNYPDQVVFDYVRVYKPQKKS